ncbi:hypothetical protein HPB48_013090 [Haemaphysalis longicornis]|uniref:Uncharacterized protein n=1 Tax=Haemaphysalis longicornis TaxID=44386 RepID=A0A9J6G6K9_HAELO|nr:hypothetical protein HPB48_013090 [Haemaphysalis longicornis]
MRKLSAPCQHESALRSLLHPGFLPVLLRCPTAPTLFFCGRKCIESCSSLFQGLEQHAVDAGLVYTCPSVTTRATDKRGLSWLLMTFTDFKMFKSYLIFAALWAYASAATVMDSNVFMDTVMTQKMPSLVRGNTKLYPFATIPDFNFKVKSTGLFNRDLKANITEGAVRHWDTAPRRSGSCRPPVLVGGKTTVACDLDLSGINTTFVAKVSAQRSARNFYTFCLRDGNERGQPGGHDQDHLGAVNTTKALAEFEAAALPGKDATLQTFRIKDFELKTKYDKALSLEEDRKKEFKKEIEKKVQTTLYELVYNDYKPLLERAVADTYFPRA